MKIFFLISVLIVHSVSSNLINDFLPLYHFLSLAEVKSEDLEAEANMTTIDLIQNMGFPTEVHNVTTEDRYILEIHRIPSRDKNSNKLPIFLQHGLLGSSADWVVNLRDQSLAFVLADAGYDVWLGNFRGSTYGKGHKRLSPKLAEFWNFGWDELAAYDLPAMIDYVLKVTAKKQLFYVGYSMGTTTGFALLATKTEYNQKIRTMFAYAPVVSMKNVKEKHITNALPFTSDARRFLKAANTYEILPSSPMTRFIAEHLCRAPENTLCITFLFKFVGESWAELNRTRLPIYLTHNPAGSSFRNIEQYAQIYSIGAQYRAATPCSYRNIKAKKWQHYDHGTYLENILNYGQLYPPVYDVKKITTAVALFYGLHDTLATYQDVAWLAKSLSNLIGSYEIGKNWNHVNFIWGINAGPLLHSKVLNILEKVQP